MMSKGEEVLIIAAKSKIRPSKKVVRTNWKADLLKTTWEPTRSVALISVDFATTTVPMYVHVHTCGAVHAFVDIYMCVLTALSNVRYSLWFWKQAPA